MIDIDFSDEKVMSLLNGKIQRIVDEANNEILDDEKFQILKGDILQNFWQDYINNSDECILILSNDSIPKLNLGTIRKVVKEDLASLLSSCKLIEFSEEFGNLRCEEFPDGNTPHIRSLLVEWSKEGNVVFYLSENGISYFIAGKEHEGAIFYSNSDRKSYYKKYSINELPKALEEYKNQNLSTQVVYSRFFVPLHSIKLVFGDTNVKGNENLMKNKPEKFMRDDLQLFLNNKMRSTFHKEMELTSSKRMLDLYTEVNDKFYLIEVKCIGKCISDTGDSVSTEYFDGYIRKGVKQTVEYTEELIVNMRTTVGKAYLAVFDARRNHKPINYAGEPELTEEQKKYLSLVEIIDDLVIDNKHPST